MGDPLRLTDANLPEYLRSRGLAGADTAVSVEHAGDGNINWVRRARLAGERQGSLIVKQARSTLERFPEYEASSERIVFEHRYYEVVGPQDQDDVCPRILHFDPEARVLVLADLGAAARLDVHLAAGNDGAGSAATLSAFLGRVHAATRSPELARRFDNDEMRRLHGEHIFVLPFRPNDFPLAPPVAARAGEIWSDEGLRARADAAWARYLEPRGSLVHGDVQAGNVLLRESGPVLLDAEIAHIGDPAFDLGTLLAHLLLPALATGHGTRAMPALEAAWSHYRAAHGPDVCTFAEVARYTGFEMLRRTIGAARIPVVESPQAALPAIEAALDLILTPPSSPNDMPHG